MYSICLIVISLITGLVKGQECSFPNQRCVCMTSTPLCRCQYITSDSTLNFSSSYKSHLVLQAGLGCTPCPSSCLDCISPTNCTSCQEQFVLVNNLCSNCPTNCRACKIVNSTSTLLFQQFQCTSCKVGYFLDSKFQCQVCPLEGSQICTADTLTSCLANYWLDNNGATCISCDQNCRQCSSTTKCSLCNDGYYVSSYKCIKCMSQCSTCISSTSCSTCLISNYYFDNTTANCMKCGTGCLQCVNASTCTLCGDANGTQFTLSQTGSCLVTNLSFGIKNCLQNKNVNSTLKCTKCLTDYYQEIGDSTCRYGCSILCLQCQGAHYGLCSSCQQNTILLNRHCIVKNNINNGTAYQVYYTAAHNYNSFSTGSNSSLNLVNRLSNSCFKESVLMGSSIKIELNNLQAYKIILKWKAYINISNSDASYSVNFANSHSVYKAYFACTNFMDSNCSNFCISKANLSISFNITQSNTLYLESNNIIGLSQLLVTSFRCGGVQGSSCLQCSQINTCTKCVNPQYFILDQLCLQQCPSNYYLYLPHRKCYKVCPLGTFNDLNNLNSRICYSCPSSCQTCSSNVTCYSCNVNFYFLEEQQQCLSECPKRFFRNQYLRKCQKCSFPCFQCETNQFCSSCRYGFFQSQSKSCTIACPAGFYANLQTRVCQMCESPCRTCQSSSTSCLECDQNHISFYGQCLGECPNGFFLTNASDLYCSPCDPLCQSCFNQTFCTSCLNGYLHENQCLLQCPPTYYPSVLAKKCHACPQNCLVCANLTHCSLCMPPTYLNPLNSMCTTQCSQLSYPQQQNYGIFSGNIQINASFICKPCVSPCYSCLSYYECLSCDSAFLLGTSCVEACIEGTFKNELNMSCTKCPINCTLCDSQSTCTVCEDGFILFEGTCAKHCPPYYYLDQSKSTCSECSLECSKCLNSTFCFNCSLGLLSFVTGKCVQDCPTGYWPDKNFTQSCLKCSGFCSTCVVNITDYIEHCTLCMSPYFLTSKNQCQLECSFGEFGASGQCYKCSRPCLSCSSQSECIGCLDKYGYAFMGDCLPACPIGYYSEITSYGNICTKCPQSCISCYILPNGTIPTCNQCSEGLFLIKQLGQCATEQQCQQFSFNQTIQSRISYYASSVLRICSQCAAGCLSCSGQSYNCSSCYDPLFYFQNKCLHICPTGYYPNQKLCHPCDYQLTNPNQTKCAICRNKQVCLQCSNNYYLFAYSTSNSMCLDQCPSGYYGKAGRCNKCKYPCLECDSTFTCSLCQNNYILLKSANQSSCVLTCPTGFYTQAISSQNFNSSYKNCSKCPELCLQCASSTECLVCDLTSVLVNKTCLNQCPKGTFRFYGSCPLCMYGCSNCVDSYTCNQCMIGFLYQGQCVNQCPYGLIQQVNISNSSSCTYCNPSCLTCKISSNICTSCSYPLFLYLEQCIAECLDGSYPSLELRQCITCTKPCQTCSNSQSCETCIYGYILYIERSRKQCVKGPLCPNSYYLDIVNNYCKLECNATQLQYSQPISRTCSKSCPEGFAAYKENMTCLYECPSKNMWVDENVNCQNGRDSLSFLTSQKLPYFNCSISSYRNIFQVICMFSTPILNLGTIRSQNIIMEEMQVLVVAILDSYQGIKIFAQPINTQQTKYTKKWIKVSIRPRYIFRGFNSVNRRYLTSEHQSYPLQNSDCLVLVPLFNFYSQEQRQTGYYLNQLSNGISIAALIIWVFSVIKNKKQVGLVMVTGLQWLYVLGTLHQNHYPPNILNFIEGFKLSFLIFGSIIPDESSGFAINSSERIWLSSYQIRTQLVTPTNFTNYKVLALPIGILISIFLLLFVVLQIICKVTKKISSILSQQSNTKEQERRQKLKETKQKKWSEDIQKKVNILLERFRFNYVHQILLLVTFPTSFLFFCQVASPQLLGLIASLFLILCLIVSWVHVGWELSNNKFFLFKEQGYKYYLIFGIENFMIGFICIFGSTTFYLGSAAIICLLNLFIYCLIFNVCEWKLKFWCILDLFRFFIIISLLACYLLAQTETRDTMFLLGWAPTILAFLYVIILTLCASRHFFEQESILFEQLKNEYKKRKQKSRSNIEKSLLETESVKKISREEAEKTTILMKYQSEQSFFEDASEVPHTDSEQQSADQILQVSENSRQNKRKQSIPKILIKRKSQIQ